MPSSEGTTVPGWVRSSGGTERLRTRAPRPRLSIEEVHRILDRAREIEVDDAVAYWLEDEAGHRLGPDSARSLAPMFLALELADQGRDPDEMLLCARLDSGERFELGGGPSLISVAEAAAGMPRDPRTPA